MSKRRILFLSAIDFKAKSIQVIKLTPEAYVKAGWEVDYIVARDNCSKGNYFYETEFDPKGVNVSRFYWPIAKARGVLSGKPLFLLNKVMGFWVICRLFFRGLKKVKYKEYDVLYGYETHGVLAAFLVKLLSRSSNSKLVSRFQGSFLYEQLKERKIIKLLFNFDRIVAIMAPTDLIIMTDDGTQGDKAVKMLRGDKHLEFWSNGIDIPQRIKQLAETHNVVTDSLLRFVTVSRLVSWKRVDRSITLFSEIAKTSTFKCNLTIVGEGERKSDLIALVKDLGLSDHVEFKGALAHSEAVLEVAKSHFLISMYESSNVGNPLLEALTLGKPVLTIDVGDTGNWVKHHENGYIWKETEDMAGEFLKAFEGESTFEYLSSNCYKVANQKISTWEERMTKEIRVVKDLFK